MNHARHAAIGAHGAILIGQVKMKAMDLALGILVTIIWGSNFSVIEIGLQNLDPNVMTTMRFALSTLPLIFFVKRPKVSLLAIAAYGTLFGVGLWWVVNLAMFKGMSPGLSSLVLQFSAFFTILLSAAFLKEPIGGIRAASMIVAFLGLVLIIASSKGTATATGTLLVLFAALAWSACNLIVKIHRPSDIVAFIIWSSAFSTLALLGLTILRQGVSPFVNLATTLNYAAAFSLIFQAYVTTIFGYSVWNSLMKKYEAAVVAPLSLIVPVSGLITSHFVFDEVITPSTWIAIALVLTGIAMFVNAPRLSMRLNRAST